MIKLDVLNSGGQRMLSKERMFGQGFRWAQTVVFNLSLIPLTPLPPLPRQEGHFPLHRSLSPYFSLSLFYPPTKSIKVGSRGGRMVGLRVHNRQGQLMDKKGNSWVIKSCRIYDHKH